MSYEQFRDLPGSAVFNVGRAFAVTTISLAVLFLGAVTYLSLTGRPEIALAAFALVLGGGLLFFPRTCFWLFLLSLTGGVSMSTAIIAIHPYDLVMALLVASFVVDFLVRHHYQVFVSSFDLPFYLLIGATLLSMVFAYNRVVSIVPTLRILLVYLAFRLVFKYAREIGVHLLIKRMLYGVAVLSFINCLLYLWSGGEERIFGIAGGAFRTMSMTALPMAFAYLLWSNDRRNRWRYGGICFLIGLALVATQSRAPLIAVFGCLSWMVILVLKMKQYNQTRIVVKWLKHSILPVLVLLVLVMIFSESLFAVTLQRYYRLIESINNPDSSIAMRLVLWSAALKAFVAHPITGIGIGNFAVIEQIFPDVTLAALWLNVSHMSAHNVVLHYMAETGTLGALAIIFLAFRGVGVTRRIAVRSLPGEDGQASFAVFGGIVIFALTIFFMEGWMWGQDGYVLSIIFGLAAARWWELKAVDQNNSGSPVVN